MQIQTYKELFIHTIQTLYDAENQILEAMPTIVEMCYFKDLKEQFQNHLHETEEQKDKLEQLCEELHIEMEGPSNLALEGMIDQIMELIQDNDPSPILDAALIASMQVIEQYETRCYGTVAEWAKQLDLTSAKQILRSIVEEEKSEDNALTELAKKINEHAFHLAKSGGSDIQSQV